MDTLAIFASGSGTNAENIIKYFQNKPGITISCICTNRTDAFVIQRAHSFEIPVLIFSREDFYQSDKVNQYLKEKNVNWIILAGFLWLVPETLILRFPNRIINIHPALLPRYGGKGMYGNLVHKAVIENGDKVSGITIHFVNHEYDRGDIIFQATCPVESSDTPESLAARIHQLEYEHFPKVLAMTISGNY
jgi:phosphoribosylglycinamide formyltransferase-1